MRKPLLITAVSVLIALAAACSKAPVEEATSVAAAGAASVSVSLADDQVALEPASVPAGQVSFAASNAGTMTHEIEVFEGDAAPESLPISSGVADTTGWTLVDEIEDITPGSSADLAVELAPGTYQVVCNLPGHFEKGMHATLTVT